MLFNDDYDGALYKQSSVIQLKTAGGLDGQPEILEPWPDLIAGILLHWVSLMLIYVNC